MDNVTTMPSTVNIIQAIYALTVCLQQMYLNYMLLLDRLLKPYVPKFAH